MHANTLAKGFKEIKEPAEVVAGSKLVWEMYSRDDNSYLYWSTVTKVTPKSIVLECKDAPHKYHDLTFRMRAYYTGAPERLMPHGNDSTGTLFCAANDDAIAIVQAAYEQRAAEKAAKEAADSKAARERDERIANDRAQAAADNPAVEWSQFTAVGNAAYYHGFVRAARGNMVLTIVSVLKVKNDSWSDDEVKAQPFIWKAAINYADTSRSQDYSPNSMGSMSDVKANTLNELFQEVIYRVWR